MIKLLEQLEEELDGDLSYNDTFEVTIDGVVFTHEDSVGGMEGGGEEHWVVVKAAREGQPDEYWKIPGWYMSYDGAHLEVENAFQVTPKQVTCVEWEKA